MNHGAGWSNNRPFSMPQSQETERLQPGYPRRRNSMAGGNYLPRRPLNSVDRNYYPPGTPRDVGLQTQPALQGPEFDQAGLEAAQMMGPNSEDIISGSNNENFMSVGLPFTYRLSDPNLRFGIVELLPNGTGSFAVQISADADFIVYKIQGSVTRDCVFDFTDAGAGRQLMSRPVTAIELLGSGFRAYNLDVPMLIKNKSSIQVNITDLGPLSRDPFTGLLVPDAGLQPSFADPAVLVNRISISFVGVKRVAKN